MARLRIAHPVLALTLLGTVACGSDSNSGGSGGSSSGGGGSGGGGGSVTTGGSGGSGGGAAGSGGGPSCAKGPGYSSAPSAQMVEEFNAKVFDVSGAPAANVPVFVCGLDVCSDPGSTTDQGVVCTPSKVTGQCSPGMAPAIQMKSPAFKYGLGIEHVKFAQLLPSTATKHDFGDVTTALLPAVSTGVAMTAGASATSGGVTLTLAPGAKIVIDTLTYDTPELEKFRAVEIPIAKAPPAVDKTKGFEILVGTTPVETHFCPHATLGVPNTPGWAAGAEVEFWMHGVGVLEADLEWAPYGGWAKVSDGKVSADGKSVVTNDGEGIPMLSVFGVKKK